MATGRYDQRNNLEEAEANAIGTEYVRADLLSPADAASVRTHLVDYLNLRILYYITRDATRQPQNRPTEQPPKRSVVCRSRIGSRSADSVTRWCSPA